MLALCQRDVMADVSMGAGRNGFEATSSASLRRLAPELVAFVGSLTRLANRAGGLKVVACVVSVV